MKNPQKFLGCPGVLNTAMIASTILYGSIGFLGYIRYGDDVQASVTLNLPEGVLYVLYIDQFSESEFLFRDKKTSFVLFE